MTPQQEFDQKYISTKEICTRLNINRMDVLREVPKMPPSIMVGGKMMRIWERRALEAYLKEWEKRLTIKRGK